MRLLTLACDSCGQSWPGARADCVYERLNIATCPCPSCGAYTLCLREPQPPPRRRRTILANGESAPRTLPMHPPEFPAKVEKHRAAG
jgi:hypothetical protein